MQKMTQAEKTMLRYQYVMANTGAASGDFLRTVNSWHNQLVLLSGAFQQLGSIVGGVLINAFKPFIQALNSVMGAVINFAQVVSDALGAIFGWEYQTGGGVAQDLELGAGAAEDIEDATGGAADNAKKLNKYIAAWHEVNNMTSNEGSKGSGGGGGAGGAGAGGDASGGEWVQAESLWEKYTSSIDTLYKLGDYIGDVLTDAMNSINWDSVYESARNFGTGLASFLNGLISPELFGAVGTTIAGVLNTVLHGLDSFGQTFDWINFGESIAAGINNFFSTFDFGLLANTINVWAHGILDYLITVIDNIQWEMIGTEIGNFLAKIDFTGIGAKVGELLWKAINAGVSLWKSSFNAAPIETVIFTALSVLKFTGLGTALTKSIIRGITGSLSIKSIGSAIAKVFSGTAIGTAIAKAFSSSTIIATISSTMAETGASLPTVLMSMIGTPIKTFFASTIPSLISGALSSISGIITGGITALAGTLGISISAAGALVAAAAAAAIAAIVAVVLNWDEVKNFFTNTIPAFFTGTVLPFFQSLPEKIGGVWDNLKAYTVEKWNSLLDFMSGLPDTIGSIISSIVEWFNNLPENIGYALGYALGTITKWAVDVYDYLSKKIPEIISNVIAWFSELPGKAYNAIIGFISKIQEWGTSAYNTFNTVVSNAITAVVNWFSELPNKIYNAIIKIKEKISSWGTQVIGFFKIEVPQIVDKVIEFFGELPKRIVEVGENLIRGLWNGINNMIDWLGTNITGFINNVIDGFKDGFDEHSPSKVAFEIGDYFTLGLANGISDRFNDVHRMVENFTSGISSTQISIPAIDLSVDTSKYQFKPMNINAGKLQAEMQQSLDYMFEAGNFIDYERLGEAVYQAQTQAMKENPVQIGDDDVFKSAQRGQIRYQRRTNKIGWAGI